MAASILTRTRRLNVFLLIGLAIRAEPFTIDVPEGTPLSIRLASALSSQHSKPGEQVRATLIAPVVVEGEELIPAGFQVQGAVQNPTPAHKKLNHAVLWIRFGDLVGKGNRSVSFRARVLSVDNGREPVDSEGVIHGLRPLPRRPTQIEDLLLLAAYAHPAILASAELGRFIVSEEEKPRITYTPGVELWLSMTAPLRGVTLPPPEIVRSAAPLVASPALNAFVSGLPLRTETPAGTPSDLINVVFLGSKERLLDTFEQAGWKPAETLDLKTETQTFFALAFHHSFREGPVSSLMISKQLPALVLEKETNTYAKRHHVRIWGHGMFDGLPVWIGAGTHDIGIDFSRKARTFSHSVAKDIDTERKKIYDDLTFTGAISTAGLIDRPQAPRSFQNATGDRLQTDGKIAVLRLK